MSAIIVSGIVTVILFLAAILCSRRIGGEGDESGLGFSFEIWGLILEGFWQIFKGITRGEFKYKFEFWVLISFVISLVIFLGLLAVEFLR